MAAQVAAVRAVSRVAEETPSLPLGDRPGRPRGGGRKRKGPPGDPGGCKRVKLSPQPLVVGPAQAESLPPAVVPGLSATPAVPSATAGLFTFSPLSLPPQAACCERRHHHRHRHRPDSGDSEPGRPSGEKPHKGRRGSSGDGAIGRPSKRGERLVGARGCPDCGRLAGAEPVSLCAGGGRRGGFPAVGCAARRVPRSKDRRRPSH